MRDDDKINELLHFMNAEPFHQTFAQLTSASSKWCPFQHKNGVDLECYNKYDQVQSLIRWTEKYLICCKYLDINKYSLDTMHVLLERLKIPERINNHASFGEIINELRTHIDFVKEDIQDKLSRLACRELVRLDEALVCFHNYCFYSAVVMAVSAVEYRIAAMIKKNNEKIYEDCFKGATLGQLIKVFQDNEYKEEKFVSIKKLMPAQHKPLVLILNNYRVFAAHPTEEKITPQIAEAILHLSFSFLTDARICPYSPEELACK